MIDIDATECEKVFGGVMTSEVSEGGGGRASWRQTVTASGVGAAFGTATDAKSWLDWLRGSPPGTSAGPGPDYFTDPSSPGARNGSDAMSDSGQMWWGNAAPAPGQAAGAPGTDVSKFVKDWLQT
jgi:hypothetical protein